MTTISPTRLSWSSASPMPLDLNGPRAVPFRRFEDAWVERPAIELFVAIAAEQGDSVACEDIEFSLTFADIWAACRRLAAAIDAGVPTGRAVGVLLPNEASYPVAVLACLGAARPCVMIDRHYPQERVAQIVRQAALGVVVMNRADIERGYLLPAGVLALAIDDALADSAAPEGFPAAPDPPDGPSFVVYTTGSTGQPKGIVLSQRGVLHRAAELVNAVHLRPDDKVLSLASPSTIGGLQQIFEVMLSGAALVKIDLQRFGLGRVVQAVAERRITMMFSTPAVWRSVARLEGVRSSLASLRCVQSSGDTLLRVDLDLMRDILPADCAMLSVYGATEAPALLQWFVGSSAFADEPRVPAGYPLARFDFALLDEQDRLVADGEIGELIIRSRFTSLGLWQDGTVIAGPFELDPVDPGLKIYRTGDLMRRRPDGLYVVLGRKDRQVKIRGNRVELAEIETALRQAPAVLDAVVIARRTGAEPLLLAFVVPRERREPEIAAELRTHLRRTLPSYMQPSRLFVLDEMPLMPGRKVDEEALLAYAADHDRAAAPAPPAALASRRARDLVDSAWRRTLGRRAPLTEDLSFEEAGGDSLHLLQLVFHLERLAGVTLSMEHFHGGLSAAQFAIEIDRCLRGGGALPEGEPLVFLFPPGGGGDAHLAAFRAACSEHLAIRQVNYPDLRVLARKDASFEHVADYAVRQILRAKPAGSLVLAGYSDGGDVAYVAACQLVGAGRKIALLCVFDSDATGLQYPQPSVRRRIRFEQFGRLEPFLRQFDWRRRVTALLPDTLFARPAVRWLVRLVLSVPFPLPANVRFLASLQTQMGLLHQLHLTWMARLRPSPLGVPVVLFRSDEPRPGAPPDIGWRSRTIDLTILPVPGDHSSMFSSERGKRLSVEFTRRVREATLPGPD